MFDDEDEEKEDSLLEEKQNQSGQFGQADALLGVPRVADNIDEEDHFGFEGSDMVLDSKSVSGLQ